MKEQIKTIYKDLVNRKIITENYYKALKPNGTQLARLYGQPKIHKDGYPLREIVDGTGSVTHNTDKFIGSIIKHYAADNEFTLKNSADYVERWKDIKVAEDEILVSYDVVSLYTSVPQDQAMNLVKDKLQGST